MNAARNKTTSLFNFLARGFIFLIGRRVRWFQSKWLLSLHPEKHPFRGFFFLIPFLFFSFPLFFRGVPSSCDSSIVPGPGGSKSSASVVVLSTQTTFGSAEILLEFSVEKCCKPKRYKRVLRAVCYPRYATSARIPRPSEVRARLSAPSAMIAAIATQQPAAVRRCCIKRS